MGKLELQVGIEWRSADGRHKRHQNSLRGFLTISWGILLCNLPGAQVRALDQREPHLVVVDIAERCVGSVFTPT